MVNRRVLCTSVLFIVSAFHCNVVLYACEFSCIMNVWYSIQYVQYSTVQYSAVQYNTVQYKTVQYSTIQYSTKQCSTEYSTVQYISLNGHLVP